ncbi:MAG: hypothetical protein E7164_00260 [Firmicutes bacterium]|nr:hypothetical protein [Bacillota bacterium]
MGHFKTISRKRKKQRQFFKLLFIIIIIFFIIFFIKKVKIDTKYLEYLTYNYLGTNLLNKEETTLIDVPVFKEESVPIVYLYNTHQTEKYKYNKLTSYNIDYSVMFASYILQSYLDEYDISSVVETNLVSKVLLDNNLKYKDSYQASRILLEQSIVKYPTLEYFIDLHRDSSIYEKTTCEINGQNYAKILFVIGLEHENYALNLAFAEKLNEKLKAVNPCLSRGILEKSGEGVDGKYNQDFHENTILLEIGGQYNEINEANNTLKVLASILYEYIMEDE